MGHIGPSVLEATPFYIYCFLGALSCFFFFSSLIRVIFSSQWYDVIGFWNINQLGYWKSKGADGPHLTQKLINLGICGIKIFLNFNQRKISFPMTDSMIGFWNFKFLANWNSGSKRGSHYRAHFSKCVRFLKVGFSAWVLYIPHSSSC